MYTPTNRTILYKVGYKGEGGGGDHCTTVSSLKTAGIAHLQTQGLLVNNGWNLGPTQIYL